MDKNRRKELAEQYSNMPVYMGVAQVKNEVNGKIYICSFTNMKNKWFTIKLSLDSNMHVNAELQEDWNRLGDEAFSYTILEEKPVDRVFDKKLEAGKMEREWAEKLQPFGDRGYNKPYKD